MPWKDDSPLMRRQQMIKDWASGRYSKAELARLHGVSRPTVHKWVSRFVAQGAGGLEERSRAPLHCPHRMPQSILDQVVDLKLRYPHWGPRKIRVLLLNQIDERDCPATSTIGDALARLGLVQPRKRCRRVPPYSEPLAGATAPNISWSADFKGDFILGDRQRCYPLTLTDNHSRYLLHCHGLSGTRHDDTRRQLEIAFRCHGLPQVLRTDNGTPFASTAAGGLSRLAVWLIRLGILPERIDRGAPQQNGRHERMHQTLKAEACQPPAASMAAQQRKFDDFRQRFNDVRPHEALDMRTPATCHAPSPRAMPRRLPAIDYDSSMQVRRVRQNGEIKWRGQLLFLSSALAKERVAITPIDNDLWQVQFATLPVAYWNDRTQALIRSKPDAMCKPCSRSEV